MNDKPASGKLYLIERPGRDTDCRYYAEHGEMGGVPDAIGYDTAAHARKFRTEDDALRYIHTELPEWGKALHKPVGLGFADFNGDVGLSATLWYGLEVPDDMLMPTTGRLRIWRR